ncbi:MAG: hypothetical protein GY793_09260 [Proteobacteria bacterium]|nr:hypothetical protein [Pseudomonadota bacterium]
MKYKKILILGPSASGKSTFAKKYAEHYNVTRLHQDEFFFNEDTSPVDHGLAITNMRNAINNDTWMIEGNYTQVINEFAKDADLIIFLEFNRFSSLFNVIKRKITTPSIEKGFGVGKNHKLPWHFIKFILFIYPKISKKQFCNLQNEFDNKLKHITSFKDFLKLQKELLK